MLRGGPNTLSNHTWLKIKLFRCLLLQYLTYLLQTYILITQTCLDSVHCTLSVHYTVHCNVACVILLDKTGIQLLKLDPTEFYNAKITTLRGLRLQGM